jgi:hypothetical protein
MGADTESDRGRLVAVKGDKSKAKHKPATAWGAAHHEFLIRG